MFERICVIPSARTGVPAHVDAGFLAEAMLFYQGVHLYIDNALLFQLVNQCGAEHLVTLVEEGFLKITYFENRFIMIGRPDNRGLMLDHRTGIVSKDWRDSLQEVSYKLFREATGKDGKGRRMAQRFCSYVEAREYDTGFNERATKEFTDTEYISSSVNDILHMEFPEYKQVDPIKFDVRVEDGLLNVDSNINFREIMRLARLRHRNPSIDIGEGTLLVRFMNIRKTLEIAAEESAEVATDAVDSAIMRVKVESILAHREHSEGQIGAFQDMFLENAKAIREVVNSGARDYRDVLRLLDKARKFQGWLKDQPSDKELLKAYYQEVSALDPAFKDLPVKVLRWLIFTVAGAGVGLVTSGIAGMVAGAGVGAVDSFLVDYMLKGWKPNQFVEGPLRKFVEGKSKSSQTE